MTIVRPRPQILITWRILFTIASILPALIFAFFLAGRAYMVATILWVVVFFGGFLFYFPFLYKSLVYIVDKSTVTIRIGVFYSVVYSIPIASIQFTSITISPFSRIFGLVSLRVAAAGARVTMFGLSLKEARSINKIISPDKKGGDNG